MKGPVCILILSLSVSAHATTLHVPADYTSIQAAVLATVNGDTVLVAPGLYEEEVAFLGRRIVLKSEGGAGSTTIRLPEGGSLPVISLTAGSDSTTVLDGFTLNGRDLVRCLSSTGSSPVVQNCIVEHGYVYRDGGGAFFENGAPTIRNTVFRYNRTDISGGGLFLRRGYGNGSARVVGNLFHNNQAPNGPAIAIIQGEGGRIERNLVFDNVTTLPSVRRGAVFVWADQVAVVNNTVDGNSLGLTVLSAAQVDSRNNIITNNPLGGVELQADVGPNTDVTFDYNDVWNNGSQNYIAVSAAPHDLSVDPVFMNAAGGDFALTPGSPCQDAGDPDPQFNDPNGSPNDLGALPAAATNYPVAGGIGFSPVGVTGLVTSLWPEISWTYVDTALGTQSAYELEVGDEADWSAAEEWSPGEVTSAATTVSYAGAPLSDHHRYYVRVRVKGSGDWGDWRMASFRTHVSAHLQVPDELPTIQAAIDYAGDGDTIEVAPGLYEESLDFGGKTIALISAAGADQTTIRAPQASQQAVIRLPGGSAEGTLIRGFTLQGQNRVRCVEGFGVSPTLAECVIEGGYVFRDGGGVFFEYGTPVIQNNVFRHNRTQITGGGLFVRRGYGHGTARIVGNVFYENTAPNGPAIGMIQGEGGHIQGNLVYANRTVLPSICRGAVYVWADHVTVWNNTIDGNSLGLTVMSASDADVRNNIITGNPLGGFELREDVGANTDITHDFNDLWNNSAGDYLGATPAPGDLSGDPWYYSQTAYDFELRLGSPCLDAGDASAEFNDADGSRNDMGALPLNLSGLPAAAGIRLWPSAGVDRVTEALPLVTWAYYHAGGAPQAAFELEVGADRDWTTAEFWSPGPANSPDESVTYGGLSLLEGGRHYLRLRVSDGSAWGSWREISFVYQVHVCGNGLVEAAEECDDGNLVAGDGCDQTCASEPMVCGNGQVEPGEECDDGNLMAGDGCDPVCQNEPALCGNGVLEYGEDCDDGNLVAGDGCNQYCDAELAVCGNGVLEAGEQCDDGNLVSGDGCDSFCDSEGEAEITLSVTTGSGNDTLLAGVPGSLVFSVQAPAHQAIAGISFPLVYTFSHGNIIGPVSESGGGAYLQCAPKAEAAFEIQAWNPIHGATATDPDTTLLGLIDLDFDAWTGSGELWRINFTPLDTGTIVVDSLTLYPGVPLEVLDPMAAALPFEWSGATITVVSGYATGDTNDDGQVTSADIIMLVNFAFKAGPDPAGCEARGDVNCSGAITASDIIRLVNFVFKAGQSPCNAGGIIQHGVWTCP